VSNSATVFTLARAMRYQRRLHPPPRQLLHTQDGQQQDGR
jgi:hypothetical protein